MNKIYLYRVTWTDNYTGELQISKGLVAATNMACATANLCDAFDSIVEVTIALICEDNIMPLWDLEDAVAALQDDSEGAGPLVHEAIEESNKVEE